MRRAESEPRQNLFVNRCKEGEKKLAWAVDYTPYTNELLNIIKTHWQIISDLPGCQSFPFVGLSKTRALRGIILKAKFQTETQTSTNDVSGHHRCPAVLCVSWLCR